MNSLKFLRLEMAMMLSVGILYYRLRPRFSNLPVFPKLLHFVFILTFAEISAAGIRCTIELCFGGGTFFVGFKQPNLLGIPPNLMCWLAVGYALAGSVFFFAVITLGELSRRGRSIFLWLVIPCTTLYPLIMGNLTGTAEIIKSSAIGIGGVFIIFGILAVLGILFYRREFDTMTRLITPSPSD